MKRENGEWLDFFGGINTIIVRDKEEFNKFYERSWITRFFS